MKKEESKKEESKIKVWGGKNMMKCNDCSCGNFKCEDAGRFCTRCGVWRIVLALVCFMIMFKIGFMFGYQFALADASDDMYNAGGHWLNNTKKMTPHMSVTNMSSYGNSPNALDNNGCNSSDATTWSKTVSKCVALYDLALILEDVKGGATNISYLITKDKNKYELFFNGSKDGLLLGVNGDMWKSDDGKYSISKNSNGKYVLSISGVVIQAQR